MKRCNVSGCEDVVASSKEAVCRYHKNERQFKYKWKDLNMSDKDWFHYDTTDKCELCGIEIKGKYKHLDHDHHTNKYRGVLCLRCNTSLGSLGDDVKSIVKVLNYLIRTKE